MRNISSLAPVDTAASMPMSNSDVEALGIVGQVLLRLQRSLDSSVRIGAIAASDPPLSGSAERGEEHECTST